VTRTSHLKGTQRADDFPDYTYYYGLRLFVIRRDKYIDSQMGNLLFQMMKPRLLGVHQK